MNVGYIIASREVTERGKPIGYMYREEPDDERDSGWRVFAGDETQEYSDDPANFAMYNASTIVDCDPSICHVLGAPAPVAFERDASGRLTRVGNAEPVGRVRDARPRSQDRGSITVQMAIVRNRLLGGHFEERDRATIAHVRTAAMHGGGAFRQVIIDGLDATVAAAEAGDTGWAALELNLLHNLPISVEDETQWDEAHFLRFELPSYLDGEIEASRIREVVLGVADALRASASGRSSRRGT